MTRLKLVLLLVIPLMTMGDSCGSPGSPVLTLMVQSNASSSTVAPFYLFANATSTTTTTAGDDHLMDLRYSWNFGEIGDVADTWSTTGELKNLAYGFVAAHIYETPGASYFFRATATDSFGHTKSKVYEVAVADPDVVFNGTKTICYSTANNFTDCPAGASNPTVVSNDFSQIVTALNGTGNKRILLRRGETWANTASFNSVNITGTTGPTILGAFPAAGAKPIITYSNGHKVFSVDNMVDVRIMDLKFVGANPSLTWNTSVVWSEHRASRLLILRCDFDGGRHTLGFDGSTVNYHNELPSDNIAIVDSTMVNMSGNNIWLMVTNGAVMGNTVTPNTTSPTDDNPPHGMRSSYLRPGVIQHNIFNVVNRDRHGVKLHGPTYDRSYGFIEANPPHSTSIPGKNLHNEIIVVSNNVFTDSSLWLAPQNDGNVVNDPHEPTPWGGNERVRNVLVERNMFKGTGLDTTNGVRIAAYDSVVRNNIASINNGATIYPFFDVYRRAPIQQPNPFNVRFYNNTCYSTLTSAVNTCVKFESGTALSAKNNVIYVRNGGGNTNEFLDTTGNPTQNTTSQNKIATAYSGPFISDFPVADEDFMPKTGSILVDTGDDLGIMEDYTSDIRGSSWDVGAYEKP